MPTHGACGKSWGGLRREHCPACHETFNSQTAGDMHRVGHWDANDRRCLTPNAMTARGMVQREGVWYSKAGSWAPNSPQRAEQGSGVPGQGVDP
jgi:hypothetical protein